VVRLNSILIIGLIFFFISPAEAQEDPYASAGLLRAQLTISPSRALALKESYFYLHGNIEGYLNSSLSLSGDGYYYLGSSSSKRSFDYHHTAFFGPSWHFPMNNHDVYIGLQPGLSFTKIHEGENEPSKTHMGINPMFAMVAGYNFFINGVFHFFVQTRYVLGEHKYDHPANLSELRLSAGLGFHLRTR
jgi:hypothetical protein